MDNFFNVSIKGRCPQGRWEIADGNVTLKGIKSRRFDPLVFPALKDRFDYVIQSGTTLLQYLPRPKTLAPNEMISHRERELQKVQKLRVAWERAILRQAQEALDFWVNAHTEATPKDSVVSLPSSRPILREKPTPEPFYTRPVL